MLVRMVLGGGGLRDGLVFGSEDVWMALPNKGRIPAT